MTPTAESHEVGHVLHVAQTLYSQKPDWVTFYRQVLGVEGVVRQTFRGQEQLADFEQTEAYLEIHRMLTELRKQDPLPPSQDEPTCVVTVRIPRSVHEALRAEAHEYRTSMNKLCISKLVQFIDNELVPKDRVPKGRKESAPEADL